jgi:glycosyltransferase involved in cell wall biosynthesis
MPHKLPISVFIIAKNEADRIHLPILSTRDWADEIIVIDSGSTDGTMEVAQKLGADKVVFNEWRGYGPQKVYGETLCRNEWLLNLDADEAVSPELAAELQQLFAAGTPPVALYAIDNVLVFPFETKPRRFAPHGYFVRLYDRRSAGFKDSTVHDSIVAKGAELPQIRLQHAIHHSSFRSYRHMIEKMNFYTDMQAQDLFKRGAKIPAWRLVLEAPMMFCKAYFGRGYWRFGTEGVVHGVFYAFARTMRLAKLRELQKIAQNAKLERKSGIMDKMGG